MDELYKSSSKKNYKQKYLKYKSKYLMLNAMNGGATLDETTQQIYDQQTVYSMKYCPKGQSTTSGFDSERFNSLCNKLNYTDKYECIYKLRQDIDNYLKGKKSTFIVPKLYRDIIEEIGNKLEKAGKEVEFRYIISSIDEPETKLQLEYIIDLLEHDDTIKKNCEIKDIILHFFHNAGASYYINLNRLVASDESSSFIITEVCNKLDVFYNIYFVDNIMKTAKNVATSNTMTCQLNRKDCNDILLDPTKYNNHFYNTEILKDVSVICGEGNRIYADKYSKIGTGTITSCMVMCIFFTNDNVLVSHFNSIITNSPQYHNEINDITKYIYTFEECFQIIKKDFRDDIKNITKIFIGGIIDNYMVSNDDNKSFIANTGNGSVIGIKDNNNIKSKLGIGIFQNIDIYYDRFYDSGHYIVTNGSVFSIS